MLQLLKCSSISSTVLTNSQSGAELDVLGKEVAHVYTLWHVGNFGNEEADTVATSADESPTSTDVSLIFYEDVKQQTKKRIVEKWQST